MSNIKQEYQASSKEDAGVIFGFAPQEVEQVALRAIMAIPGRHHYTRVDLRCDAEGRLYIIDINERPGFGPQTTLHKMCSLHKIDEGKLLCEIIETSHIYPDLTSNRAAPPHPASAKSLEKSCSSSKQ